MHLHHLFLVFTIASLPVVSSTYLRAVFDMNDIRGEIKFTDDPSNQTRISLNLTGINSSMTWQIHRYSIVYRGNHIHTCPPLYTGGMFDPYGKSSGKNYTTQCNSTMQSMCAIGDLNGKHGYLHSATDTLLDSNLPLSGANSIFGRSVVLYVNGTTPWACALIDYEDVITAVATFRGVDSGITGTIRLRQPRSNADMDTSVEVNLFYSNDATVGSYNLTLAVANDKLPEEGIPSYEGDQCKISTSQVLSNRVNVPLARYGPSSERLHFSVSNLPLAGSTSTIGKTLVLKLNGDPKICASVYELLPIEAEAMFDIDGVKGTIYFKQDSELAPTVVRADVGGLDQKAKTYHVHVYRVLGDQQNVESMCGNKYLAGHWNPYGVNSAEPGTRTFDKYEVGDLSGKYGTIEDKDTLSLNLKDYNLPLFGEKSILFRSMVIHYKDGSRWVCTNIDPKSATFRFKVKTGFVGPEFNGTVTVEQASFMKTFGASHIATFFLDLQYSDPTHPTTGDHNWHVHDQDIIKDQMSKVGERCVSAKGHYNPYKVSLAANYSDTCGPKNLLRCELGDSSSKLGKYSIGGGKNRFIESENYFAGLHTILGRSIVVHDSHGKAPRIGCANMELISKSFVRQDLMFENTTASEFSKELAAALKVKQWRVIHDKPITDYGDHCKKTSFLLIDSTSSDLAKDFQNLKKNWPETLKEFKPWTEEECSHALNLKATSLVLVIGYLLSYLLG